MERIYRAIDGQEFKTEFDCHIYERELDKAAAEKEKLENEEAEKKFFSDLGFEGTSGQWIKFDRLGNYIGVAEIGNDFKDYDEMNRAFMKENVYGHALDTFKGRNKSWYDMPLIDKVHNLCWLKTEINGVPVIANVWGGEKNHSYTIICDGKHHSFFAKNKADARQMVKAVGITDYIFE